MNFREQLFVFHCSLELFSFSKQFTLCSHISLFGLKWPAVVQRRLNVTKSRVEVSIVLIEAIAGNRD